MVINMNRLAELRKERKLSMAQVARDLGMPYTTYVNYEKGTREPNSETLILFANYFSASVDYLVGRSDDRINDSILDIVNEIDEDILNSCDGNLVKAIEEQKQRNKNKKTTADKLPSPPEGIAVSPIKKRTFPLLGEIACGEPITANENLEVYVDAGADIEADFCLRAKGDSMSGARIYDGDIVFIRKQSMVDNGEIAAVIIDNEATLKRVSYYPQKNLLILKSENPKYEDFIFTDEQLENISIIGKAVFFQGIVK